MSRKTLCLNMVLLLAVGLPLAAANTAQAQGCAGGGCYGGGCASGYSGDCHCPLPFCCPRLKHCTPKAPKIKWCCTCGKPACNPCELQQYGYYPTCWRPWTYPPNYGHCPTPGPAMSSNGLPPIVSATPTPPAAAEGDPTPTPTRIDYVPSRP